MAKEKEIKSAVLALENSQAVKAKEAKPKQAKETKKAPKKESKFFDLIEKIEKMSVKELNEFVADLESVFGPVVMAISGSVSKGANENETNEEKSEFEVELTSVGSSVIQVIKAVKEITGQGLVDAKKMVDSAPTVIKAKVKKEEAEELKKKLEAAGAFVTLK